MIKKTPSFLSAKPKNGSLLPDKKYNIIYADPPWKQSKGGLRKSRPNQTRKLDYETISLSEIHTHMATARSYSFENHSLFLWSIDKYLNEAENMAKELGYRLHARLVWDKENGVAPAFTVRFSHEYLLWFYCGKFQPVARDMRGKYTTVIRERSVRHSQKPIEAYEMIEKLYPNSNRLEMYARARRDGWDSWGNELDKQNDLTVEDFL